MNRPKTLDVDQLAALIKFRNAKGRRWKTALRTAWITGKYPTWAKDYSGSLQQIRNQIAPTTLNRITDSLLRTWELEDACRATAYENFKNGNIIIEGMYGAEPEVDLCEGHAWVQAWVLVQLPKETGDAPQ